MIFCNQDISNTLTAMSFKLDQVIENNEDIYNLVKLRKSYFIFSYCPLQILALKTCSRDISKAFTAISFKLGQLIEDNE